MRARLVAGSEVLAPEFNAIRAQVLALPRDDHALRKDIVEMRERMYHAKKPPEGERRDLKHSRGGMVDIEFMVQYWVLRHANSIGSGDLNSANIELLKMLFQLNLISRAEAQLVEIYQDYHRLLHQSVLQNESSEVDAGPIQSQLEHVTSCWNRCFGVES